jgi:AcrR family transcriptional regulator
MIIEAVTPLIIQHGRQVTSQQMAAAAGIAEGTIFRAFGDKDSLIQAAVDKNIDPEPFRQELRAIPADAPLEQKIQTVVSLMQGRFSTVFRMVAALGTYERPPHPEAGKGFAQIIGDLLRPDLARLNLPPERIAQVIRLVTLSTSLPAFNSESVFTVSELTEIVLYGIAGTPRPAAES